MGTIGLLLLSAAPASAKIAPIPFAELVARADFVGIVECETAGAIVATYKVIESCRGAKAGERINLRSFVRGPGPQFRHSMVGERSLVTAIRAGSHEDFVKRSTVMSQPLGWRNLHADYDVPYGQGPFPEGPDTKKQYEEAKKLVAAQGKAEFKLPKPLAPAVWSAPPLPRPTAAQLEVWRARLVLGAGPPKNDEYAKARDGLLAYDPAPLFDELVKWAPGEKLGFARAESAYSKASLAAWRCGQDREKHLKMLLTAQEPVVRVAGAIYLCFENEKVGMGELAELSKLEGEAGGWAALTLARRGQKEAVPRVLKLFGGSQRASRFEVNLRLNALVLFSNSAKKAGVAQPPSERFGAVEFETIQGWWQKHADKITLHDPWLETLSKQKID
ncbi:MAG: hypothetical protein HY289_10705 [Planctomycetes bacterium]|nr:hypothetical protein [Planctomycetota bacterium]